MYISNVNTASINMKEASQKFVPDNADWIFDSEDTLYLIYIHKGAATYTANDIEGEVRKRDILLVNPKQRVEFQTIRKIDAIIIGVSGVLFTSSLEINSPDELFQISDTNRMIKYYLDLILVEDEARFRGSEIIIKKLLECIMVHILRNNELSIKDAGAQVKHDEIEKVQTYIRENYGQKISLDQLSELVDINKYYLIRLFKQKTGLSPIDFLIHVRLAEAEKLLAQTDISISKISDQVGFHSPSHFSKTFRENNHLTPSAYRKKHRK